MIGLLQRVSQASVEVEDETIGRFGSHMRVSLINDGPVTFWPRVEPARH